mgnify:CR=1 FL=1
MRSSLRSDDGLYISFDSIFVEFGLSNYFKQTELLSDEDLNAEIDIIYQTVDNLHKACPKNLGDWYFTGNYPTDGGNRVVNRAFINFYSFFLFLYYSRIFTFYFGF